MCKKPNSDTSPDWKSWERFMVLFCTRSRQLSSWRRCSSPQTSALHYELASKPEFNNLPASLVLHRQNYQEFSLKRTTVHEIQAHVFLQRLCNDFCSWGGGAVTFTKRSHMKMNKAPAGFSAPCCFLHFPHVSLCDFLSDGFGVRGRNPGQEVDRAVSHRGAAAPPGLKHPRHVKNTPRIGLRLAF